MSISRRNFILTGVSGLTAAALTGCTDGPSRELSALPTTPWPELQGSPKPTPSPYLPPSVSGTQPTPHPVPLIVGDAGSPSNPIARAHWTSYGPLMNEINPMNGVHRITLHHEGYTAVDFADVPSTARRMENIRATHVGKRWADIGYHYVIDRAGRVWEGRNTRYQGAHVKDDNEHNLGIMCLGNFEIQQPTEAQLSTLQNAVRYFRSKYGIPITSVKTHQEMPRAATLCPGRNLQPRIVAMRHNGYFA